MIAMTLLDFLHTYRIRRRLDSVLSSGVYFILGLIIGVLVAR